MAEIKDSHAIVLRHNPQRRSETSQRPYKEVQPPVHKRTFCLRLKWLYNRHTGIPLECMPTGSISVKLHLSVQARAEPCGATYGAGLSTGQSHGLPGASSVIPIETSDKRCRVTQHELKSRYQEQERDR